MNLALTEAYSDKHYTLAEYQQLEETTDTRYEYHQGEVYAMSGPSRPGASRKHSAISSNVASLLRGKLPEGCRPFDSDLKVYVEYLNKSFHPDVSIACRPIEGPDQMNAISNPVLLVEVLSESTAAYDRGQKFWFYSRLTSLKEYVLIEQDEPSVEVRYRAASDQEWVMNY